MKSIISFKFIAFLCIFFSGSINLVFSESLTLRPTDDAHVDEYNRNSNSGSSTKLVVRNKYGSGSSNHWEYNTYIRFDISEIPRNAYIREATIWLSYRSYTDENPENRRLSCYRVLEYWNEDNITYANQPDRIASRSISEARVPTSTQRWMSFEVTSDVKEMYNGYQDNYGWIIMDKNEWGRSNIPMIKFNSKEAGNYEPYLEIEYESDRYYPGDRYGDRPRSDTYYVGDGVYEYGAVVTVECLQDDCDGRVIFDGDRYYSRIEINDAMVDFNFGSSPCELSLTYEDMDRGSEKNIWINTELYSFRDFTDLDNRTIGGVRIRISEDGNYRNYDDSGKLYLESDNDDIKHFAIGGRDLSVENVDIRENCRRY